MTSSFSIYPALDKVHMLFSISKLNQDASYDAGQIKILFLGTSPLFLGTNFRKNANTWSNFSWNPICQRGLPLVYNGHIL